MQIRKAAHADFDSMPQKKLEQTLFVFFFVSLGGRNCGVSEIVWNFCVRIASSIVSRNKGGQKLKKQCYNGKYTICKGPTVVLVGVGSPLLGSLCLSH